MVSKLIIPSASHSASFSNLFSFCGARPLDHAEILAKSPEVGMYKNR
jgi:hypothetical protein